MTHYYVSRGRVFTHERSSYPVQTKEYSGVLNKPAADNEIHRPNAEFNIQGFVSLKHWLTSNTRMWFSHIWGFNLVLFSWISSILQNIHLFLWCLFFTIVDFRICHPILFPFHELWILCTYTHSGERKQMYSHAVLPNRRWLRQTPGLLGWWSCRRWLIKSIIFPCITLVLGPTS